MTPYQYRLFASLRQLIRENGGLAPSRRELGEAWEIKGMAAVQRHLGAMEAAGLIRRLPYRGRAIEITRFCIVQSSPNGDAQLVGLAA